MGKIANDALPVIKKDTFKGHVGSVLAVRYNNDGNYCMTGGSDKTVKLWKPVDGLCLKTYIGHGFGVLDAASSNDNSIIASGSEDKTVIVWDVSTGKRRRQFRDHLSKVNCVSMNRPECTVVVSGSYDSTVKCWDCRSSNFKPIQTLDEAKDSISTLNIADHEIITGSIDNHVRHYDMRRGLMVEDNIGESVTSVAVTTDGQCFLSSSLDGKIRLFDRKNGKMLQQYEGHINVNYKVDSTFTFDDKYIASGSEDGKVHFWDLLKEAPIHTLTCHDAVVSSITLHPETYDLLCTGPEGVTLWCPTVTESED